MASAKRSKSSAVLGNTSLNLNTLLGALFIVMALLQALSFNNFKETLTIMDLSGPAVWAVGIILAEILAAIGLVGMAMTRQFWAVCAGAAVVVSGFWFFETLQVIASGKDVLLTNSGLFGKYLPQVPGWWTVVETSLLLFWVINSVSDSKET